MATPTGGMTGKSTAYRLGETTRGVVQNLAKPVIGGLAETGKAINAVGGMAKDIYKGVRGIPEETNLSVNANPIRNAAAADNAMTAKVVQRPAAGTQKSAPAPAAQWTRGEAISSLGNGMFATGQGEPTHQRWGVNQGGVISNLTLPIGQNPNEMNPADYQSLIEKQDTGSDVTVGRGLREFKGEKEQVNSMTGQRRLADQIASMMSEYTKAVGAAPSGAEAANIIGNIASGEAGKEQSRIASDAAVRAAQTKASEGPMGVAKTPLLDEKGQQVKDIMGEPILTHVPAQRIGSNVLFIDPVGGPRLVPIEQVQSGNTSGGRKVSIEEFKKLLLELGLDSDKKQKNWLQKLFD